MTPLEQAHIKPVVQNVEAKNIGDFQYVNKFKSALYVFILFIILSHKVAYKVLDIILKVFTNNIEVIDNNENPMILGTIIMSFILAFIIFIF
jgi:hypothetical protein